MERDTKADVVARLAYINGECQPLNEIIIERIAQHVRSAAKEAERATGMTFEMFAKPHANRSTPPEVT